MYLAQSRLIGDTFQIELEFRSAGNNVLLVCLRLCINKTCIRDVYSERRLNTDTRIIRTLLRVRIHGELCS